MLSILARKREQGDRRPAQPVPRGTHTGPVAAPGFPQQELSIYLFPFLGNRMRAAAADIVGRAHAETWA